MHTMLQQPFFTALSPAKRILLAGAGGGFDVFCGLPLYFALRDAGKGVFLANLSFSLLEDCTGRRLTPALLEVTADSQGPGYINYFPEGYLCQHFREQGEEVSIWCLERTGVVPLRAAYLALLEHLHFDTLLLIDGGTDSLMRGDEEGLGTPHEDIASLAATCDLPVERKLLACLGFGIDHFHEVCHFHFLEAVAELTRAGAFLGAFALTPDMPEVQRYRAATMAVCAAMPRHPSIVNTSILSAIEGRYGDYHATDRTFGSVLWINALMTLYWCFQLEPVARRVLYLEEMMATKSREDVHMVIMRWLGNREHVRPATPIPL
jgi:hypothetical protein